VVESSDTDYLHAKETLTRCQNLLAQLDAACRDKRLDDIQDLLTQCTREQLSKHERVVSASDLLTKLNMQVRKRLQLEAVFRAAQPPYVVSSPAFLRMPSTRNSMSGLNLSPSPTADTSSSSASAAASTPSLANELSAKSTLPQRESVLARAIAALDESAQACGGLMTQSQVRL
jgi:hypothetical protein